ncbi:MAG: lyase family protein [Gemmatimonadales bacterium]
MKTLWSGSGATHRDVLAYTVGDDRAWDARLLPWDILGSLGHIEGLRAAKLLSAGDHTRLRAGLRRALRSYDAGRLRIGREHEDAHSAVEAWLTKRLGAVGERVHTGRSRNDQVAVDVRLWAKDRLLGTHEAASRLAAALLGFARRERGSLWPGYTHLRRAMPSSAGLWAAALAEGLLDTLESFEAVWRQLDRSPLGSAAGYGAPLPLDRERVARALGFAEVEHAIGSVQNGRGKLEAAALFWAVQLGHDIGKLATDVVLLTGEEFGLLVLPASLATGSSIMPHKRNPDVFELTRARVALIEAQLSATLGLRAKLTSGYHRDFQLLKAPLMAGLDTATSIAAMMATVVPLLEVRRGRGRELLEGGALATDEVMRRVEAGIPFRRAYREVAAALKRGERFPAPSATALIARRRSTGGIGNLDLGRPAARLAAIDRWRRRERARFDRAMHRLAGRRR